jgi:hypothetical protein
VATDGGAVADSGEPEVQDRWKRGRGTTSGRKKSDSRSWGRRELTDKAIHGGAHRAGKSGGEGPVADRWGPTAESGSCPMFTRGLTLRR